MNYFKLILVGFVGVIFFIGNMNMGEAKGKVEQKYEITGGQAKLVNPSDEKEIAKQALLKVFAEEIKKYPALKGFLTDESKKAFQHALVDLQAKRNGGGFEGVTSWIGEKNNKDWYIRATGISDFMKEPTLALEQEKQIAKQALLKVFEEEIKKYPALKDFLMDESKKAFQHALADLQAKRDGGGLNGVTSWIKKGKDWYLNATGINDFMAQEERRLAKPEIGKELPILAVPMPEITSVPKANIEPEEMMEMYGKNFTYKKKGDNFNYSNYKEIFFVKDGVEIKAKDVSVNVSGAPDGGNLIRLRTPKEAGTYSLKIMRAEGEPIIWNKTLVAVAKELPPTPVLTHVPDKAIPEEMMEMYGKNFTYKKKGDSFNYSNYRDIFFVKDGVEIKAKDVGVNVTGAPDGGNLVRLRTPKEGGTYSLKVTRAEGEPIIWNKTLVAVAKELPPTPVLTHVPDKAIPEEMMEMYGKNFTYKKKGDSFNYSNYREIFFVKDGVEIRAKDVGVNVTGAPDGGNLVRLRTPKEAGTYSLKIVLNEGEPVIWNKTLVAVKEAAAVGSRQVASPQGTDREIKSAGHEGIKPAIPENRLPEEPQLEKEPASAEQEEQREPVGSGEEASSEGQVCDENIPKYQQPGCVEKNEKQKRSPYDGLPCPDESVPNYSKIGCIP